MTNSNPHSAPCANTGPYPDLRPIPQGQDQWGPTCALCGDEEFRIDGYCSIEHREYHEFHHEVQDEWARGQETRVALVLATSLIANLIDAHVDAVETASNFLLEHPVRYANAQDEAAGSANA